MNGDELACESHNSLPLLTPSILAAGLFSRWKHERSFSVGKDGEKMQPSFISGGGIKWCSNCGKLSVVPQKAKYRISI